MLAPLLLAASIAVVTQDQTQLRAAPKASAQQHVLLSQGEVLEVRGERLDFLQVYDYRRERGGFVRASLVKRLTLTPDQAPGLLAVVRFLRDTPGQEYRFLSSLHVADYLPAQPRFGVHYELLNMPRVERIRVKAMLADPTSANGAAAEATNPAAPGREAEEAAFDEAAFKGSAIPLKYKELMAVAVALTTQCPYCIEVHTKKAKKAGATEQELAETTLVTAALRAGATLDRSSAVSSSATMSR